MATVNPFDLLGDDDNDDPSHLIALQQQKMAAKKPDVAPPAAAAKLPSKPLPPQQSVREARSNAAPARGGAGRGVAPRGRGGRGGRTGPNRSFANGDANGFSGSYGATGAEDLDAGKTSERERGGYGSQRGSYRGGRRGGYENGEAGGDSERPQRRSYERHSGTGRGYEVKRDGAGRGNWGTTSDDVFAQVTDGNVQTDELTANPEKLAEKEDELSNEVNKDNKEGQENEKEEKELEDKEMTLEEYEKVLDEKRKALLAMKTEERKVDFDKEFESMKQLSIKKGNDEVFIKLSSDKDVGKKRDNEREERCKKSLSINEFLKPAEGERHYNPGGRGRGRGRGDRGSFRGSSGSGRVSNYSAPSIEDPRQFPTLGGK